MAGEVGKKDYTLEVVGDSIEDIIDARRELRRRLGEYKEVIGEPLPEVEKALQELVDICERLEIVHDELRGKKD